MRYGHTWAHVVNATSAEFVADLIGRCETEISQCDAETAIEAEHVLWLEIAMVDPERVAAFDGVEKLKKDVLNEIIITEISAAMQNLSEQVAVASVIHDNKRVLVVLDDTMEGHNVRVRRGQLMKSNFANVELPLAGILHLRVHQALNGVGLRAGGARIDCAIDDSVTSDTQNLD